MIPSLSFLLRRSGLAYLILAAVGFSILLLLGHSPTRTYFTPTYAPGNFSIHERSAWFAKGGNLRFDTAEGWGTVYETRMEDLGEGEGGYTCDSTASVGTLCLSKIKLLRALIDNSVAQHRALEGGGEGDAELRRSYTDLEGLRGKRLLYLGDSTDRSSVDEIARALPTGNWHMYEPVSGVEIPEFPAAGSQHTTRFVAVRFANSSATSFGAVGPDWKLKDTIHPDEVRLDFLFTFGVFDSPAHDAQPDDFVARLGLIDPLLGRHVHYDLVCINAGLWDIQKFGREHPWLDYEAGLTSAWIERYINRFILVIKRIRMKYGTRVPIAIRLMHDIAPTSKTPKFTARRAAQLRAAQLDVVRRTGVRVLPFAELMQGQPYHYTPDGAHPNPAGNMLHSETMLRLLAEA